jgi:hypothetical protein
MPGYFVVSFQSAVIFYRCRIEGLVEIFALKREILSQRVSLKFFPCENPPQIGVI